MPGPPLRGNFLAARDVDHVDGEVGELRRKGRGEIVAARFDQDEVERRESAGAFRAITARLIDASSRMAVCRAAFPILHAHDALDRRERTRFGRGMRASSSV